MQNALDHFMSLVAKFRVHHDCSFLRSLCGQVVTVLFVFATTECDGNSIIFLQLGVGLAGVAVLGVLFAHLLKRPNGGFLVTRMLVALADLEQRPSCSVLILRAPHNLCVGLNRRLPFFLPSITIRDFNYVLWEVAAGLVLANRIVIPTGIT